MIDKTPIIPAAAIDCFRVNETKQIVESIIEGESKKLLDIGCSKAMPFFRTYDHLLSNSEIHLLDLSPPESKDSETTNSVTIHKQDIFSFEKVEYFDYVIATEFFEHIKEWSHLLETVAKWLKPGGKLIMSSPTSTVKRYLYARLGIVRYISDQHFWEFSPYKVNGFVSYSLFEKEASHYFNVKLSKNLCWLDFPLLTHTLPLTWRFVLWFDKNNPFFKQFGRHRVYVLEKK